MIEAEFMIPRKFLLAELPYYTRDEVRRRDVVNDCSLTLCRFQGVQEKEAAVLVIRKRSKHSESSRLGAEQQRRGRDVDTVDDREVDPRSFGPSIVRLPVDL